MDLLDCLASLSVILLPRDSIHALWAGIIGLSLFMASVFHALMVLAGERVHVNGTMTGWFLVGGLTRGMTLPWIIGQAFVGIGEVAMPVLVLVTITFNLFVIILFNARPIKYLTSIRIWNN